MNPKDKREAVSHLASVFKGGRISGWVARNRQPLRSGNRESVELDLLLQLSPGFAQKTAGLPQAEMIQLIKEALALADENPLSATRLVV